MVACRGRWDGLVKSLFNSRDGVVHWVASSSPRVDPGGRSSIASLSTGAHSDIYPAIKPSGEIVITFKSLMRFSPLHHLALRPWRERRYERVRSSTDALISASILRILELEAIKVARYVPDDPCSSASCSWIAWCVSLRSSMIKLVIRGGPLKRASGSRKSWWITMCLHNSFEA